MQGKTATAVNDLHAGDIGAIAKLKDTTTGETLGDKNAPIFYPPARIPEPSITFAIEPKTRADEDRIGVAIHKILEEDLALRFGARSANEGISALRRRPAAHRSRGRQAAQALSRGDDAASRPRFPTARRFAARPTPKASTRSRPAATASSASAASRWSRCRAARESNSWTTFSAAQFRRTGFRRSKKVSAIPPSAAISPAFRSSISA